MKPSTALLAALAALASTASARQSDRFYLVAVSDNPKVNGTYFYACHEGAAIEALCVGGKKPDKNPAVDTYRLNNTASMPNQGVLSWLLVGSDFKGSSYFHPPTTVFQAKEDFVPVSEPMSLYASPSTNVALPLFQPGYDTQYVGFDKEDKLYISYYIDDTVTPPKTGKSKKLYNWYTCETYYTGYTYTTLAWVFGLEGAEPQNPSCEGVEVVRVFK